MKSTKTFAESYLDHSIRMYREGIVKAESEGRTDHAVQYRKNLERALKERELFIRFAHSEVLETVEMGEGS